MRLLAGVRRSRLFTISYPDSSDSSIIWRPFAKKGDRAWAKFQAQMKQKRVQKKTKADTGLGAGVILKRGELTVQRLSSEVSGKAQKFSRIGTREFVPFADYEDITLPNIKLACEKHFLPTVGKSVTCDVLAGE